jgi:hypothetical protein
MASDEPVGVTNTNTPSEEELNTVVVHPAVRDIPEHTELFRWASVTIILIHYLARVIVEIKG